MNNFAQSNPEGELERLGGVDRGGDVDAERGEDSGGVQANGEVIKDKKSKAWVVWLVTLGLLLVGVGVVVVILQPWNRGEVSTEGTKPESGLDSEEKSPVEDGSDEDAELVKLSIDDELVQRLYQQVSGAGKYSTTGRYLDLWLKLAKTSEATDEYVKYVALSNTDVTKCKVTGRSIVIPSKHENGMAFTPTQVDGEHACLSGADVRAKAQEIFGRDVKFAQNEAVEYLGYFAPFYYDAENDEFWQSIGYGGGIQTELDNILYRAEKDKERIYIYELMAQRCSVFAGQDGEYLDCAGGLPGSIDDDFAELRWFRINPDIYDGDYANESWIGSSIPEMTSTEFKELADYMKDDKLWGEAWEKFREQNRKNMLDHADLVSQFRWVFVKTPEGNYVFEKLERIN